MSANIPGNYYNKYESKNPLVKFMMNGFLETFDGFVRFTNASSVHEIGCGEGVLTKRLAAMIGKVMASDIEPSITAIAEKTIRDSSENLTLKTKSIYDFDETDYAELIVCCEVLEHLEDPDLALKKIFQITGQHVLLSVPREPIWRMLNIARGKYLTDLGNTPGHIQHWTKNGFINFVEQYFLIEKASYPLPWTMVLCRKKS